MAIGRTEFVNRVESKINEIVQNLALIMYPSSSDMVKSHWKLDLTVPLLDLTTINLRRRNSEKARMSAVMKALNEDHVFLAHRKFLICYIKFVEEHIEPKEEWFISVNDEMNAHIKKFVEFCAKVQIKELRTYIKNL